MDASQGEKQHRERGETAPDPHEVIRARRRRFLSTDDALAREALARDITINLGRSQVTGRSIQKIELGEAVEPHALALVLIELGLRAPPSPKAPADGETPGAWCQSSRLARGCSRPMFCAPRPGWQYLDKLSPPYVGKVEGMHIVPTFLKLDAFSERFEQHGLRIDGGTLQKAWWRWDRAAAASAWRGQLEEIGEMVRLKHARTIVAQSAAASMPQLPAGAALRHSALAPIRGKSGLRVVGRIASARLGWLVIPVAAVANRAVEQRRQAVYVGYGDDENDLCIARLSDGSPLSASAIARALRLQEEMGVHVFS
ncbi:MAG: hypothetical protein ACR2K4_10640 [Candidatus Limnocylindria bacterium]